jgi:hypothetical protein
VQQGLPWYLAGNPIPMQLMMYIGNDLIEAVPLDKEKVPVPGYLGNIKRHLKEKYETLIAESSERPEFLVIGMQIQLQNDQSV